MKEMEFRRNGFGENLNEVGVLERYKEKGQGLFTPYNDAIGGEDTTELVIRIHT